MKYEKLKRVEDITGKTLVIAGKTLATIVCPPVGVASWFKKASERGRAFGLATILSVGLSAIIDFGIMPKARIYDNPSIKVPYVHKTFRIVPGIVFSPLAVYLDGEHATRLREGDLLEAKDYDIQGSDVIQFNDGKYTLNFPLEKKFSANKVYWQSVQQAQNEFDRYHEQGNILKARKAKERLEEVTANYNELKGKFQQAVDKMNSELEQLAEGGGRE